MLGLFRCDAVLLYMRDRGFINPVTADLFVLSDYGRKIKLKRGYNNYLASLEKIEITDWYNSELAKSQYEDYPKVRREARLAIILAVISIVVTIAIEYCKRKAP